MGVVRAEGEGGSGHHNLGRLRLPEVGLLYLFHLTSVLIFSTTSGADGPGPTLALSSSPSTSGRNGKGLLGVGRSGGHEGEW